MRARAFGCMMGFLACFVGTGLADDAPARHAIGIQPFIIPITVSTRGLGYGGQVDFEYALSDRLGLVAGYLTAQYEEELTYYSTYSVRKLYEDVTLDGPIVGARFRMPTPIASDPGQMVLGGTVGFCGKEDEDGAGQIVKEDVLALYLTLGYAFRWEHLELGFGSDLGAITGDDAGPFVTTYFRAGLVF